MSLPKTAIVVDDNPSQGAQLAGILRRRGFAVLAVCESGDSGLREILARKPTLATVDVQMPGLGGIDVVRLARERGSAAIFVTVSGTAQAAVQARALAAGAALFVAKPYDNVVIGAQLDALVRD